MVVVRAPVRISFGGGGTDLAAYSDRFGGLVVSAAITRYCYVAARRPADGGIHINSADYRVWESFGPGELPPVAEPLSLPKAALALFADRSHRHGRGLREGGVDLFLASEVPPGTGLGSSSAMAVALVRALAVYSGAPPDAAATTPAAQHPQGGSQATPAAQHPQGGSQATPAAQREATPAAQREAAELACWLEIERLDRPIGKQDQYASAFGGLNQIEFTAGGVSVRPLPVGTEVLEALGGRLLLFSTGQSRDSAAILRQQRADTGAKPAVVESLHRIKALAGELREALLGGDLDRFGELLDLGWRQKRSLSGQVSSAAIDGWYDAARAAGALGGKITGAGGGGFLLLYCPPERRGAVRAALAGHRLRELSFDFDLAGVQVLAGDTAIANR